MIQYFQTKSTAKVEQIFQNGLALGGDIGQALKPLYMEWLVLTKGMGCARRIFESPELQHPPCLELFTKMASLESIQPDANMKAIRRCHELACKHFGKDNTGNLARKIMLAKPIQLLVTTKIILLFQMSGWLMLDSKDDSGKLRESYKFTEERKKL